jgi:hypothetical protein
MQPTGKVIGFKVVARYEIEQRIEDPLRRFFYIRVKAHLIDGSSVDISRRISKEEDVFSRFWIRKDGKVIGWNDYPHHPEIPTFPYHEHEYHAEHRKLRPTEIKNVEEALSKIEEEMLQKEKKELEEARKEIASGSGVNLKSLIKAG